MVRYVDMVPLVAHEDETLAAYLSRCRAYATAHRETVVARYDGFSVHIQPRMTAADVADAWMTAKRMKQHSDARKNQGAGK